MGAVSFQDVEPLGLRPHLLPRLPRVAGHDGRHDRGHERVHGRRGRSSCSAVSFFTAADSVTYTVEGVRPFRGRASSWTSWRPRPVPSVHRGFDTVDLSSPVLLAEGDDFYVYLSLSAGACRTTERRMSPVLPGAHYRTIVESLGAPGESYYWTGSTWNDLYYYDDGPWIRAPGTSASRRSPCDAGPLGRARLRPSSAGPVGARSCPRPRTTRSSTGACRRGVRGHARSLDDLDHALRRDLRDPARPVRPRHHGGGQRERRFTSGRRARRGGPLHRSHEPHGRHVARRHPRRGRRLGPARVEPRH